MKTAALVEMLMARLQPASEAGRVPDVPARRVPKLPAPVAGAARGAEKRVRDRMARTAAGLPPELPLPSSSGSRWPDDLLAMRNELLGRLESYSHAELRALVERLFARLDEAARPRTGDREVPPRQREALPSRAERVGAADDDGHGRVRAMMELWQRAKGLTKRQAVRTYLQEHDADWASRSSLEQTKRVNAMTRRLRALARSSA